jgi:hypothetical protein
MTMSEHKIIIPTGYMGSGSSAVTDLLREYPCLNTKNADFEYIFLHAPGGLFDLEQKLLHNNNAIRSDEAIKTFRSLMRNLFVYRGWWPAGYNHAVSKDFLEIVDEYLNSINTVSFEGNWYIYDKPSYLVYLMRSLRNRGSKLLNLKIQPKKKNVQKLEISILSEKEFYEKSKQFITNVINEINTNNQDIVLDQLLLPHNLSSFEKYEIENVFPILVQRDPRDVYISNKYYWAPMGSEVPYPLDVHEFCKYYRAVRESEIETKGHCLRINFEDLIIHYDDVVSKIESYLNLDSNDHTLPKAYLNPNQSINNLRIFSRSTDYEREIEVINKELAEYLYPFPEKLEPITGEVF